MNKDIRVSTRKVSPAGTRNGYKGVVTVYENGRYLRSRSTPHVRLTKEDALKDARRERDWILDGGVF